MLTAFISVAVNSLSIVVSFSPFCTCTSLLPSKVQTLFTFLPSTVSSSNSSPSLNFISEFLKVLLVFSVYTPSFSVNSTIGLTLLPILRVTIPTPERRRKLFESRATLLISPFVISNLPDTFISRRWLVSSRLLFVVVLAETLCNLIACLQVAT